MLSAVSWQAPLSAKGVVEAYLKHQRAAIFAGAFAPPPGGFGPLPVAVPRPPRADVARAAALLRRARRPVLLVGSQATLICGGATRAEQDANSALLTGAIRAMGVPTFLGGMARGLLGRADPLHVRQQRTRALREADVVLMAGAVCDFRMNYGRSLSRRSKVVAINRDPAHLTLNADLFWTPAVASRSDPGLFLVALADAMRGGAGGGAGGGGGGGGGAWG